MNERDWLRLQLSSSDVILQDLSTRQHLQPHRPLRGALEAASESLGFCPRAAATALEWLQLDGARAIGRLRRTEIIQLARCIHRFWRQAVATRDAQPQSV